MRIGLIGQIHHGQHPAHQVVIALLGRAQQPGHHADVLGHRHVGEQAHLLDDIADAAAQLIPVCLGHVLAVEIDMPAVRLDQAVDHFQGGGLAAAGRADEDGKLPLFDFKIQVVENGLVSIVQGHMLEADQNEPPFCGEHTGKHRKRGKRGVPGQLAKPELGQII